MYSDASEFDGEDEGTASWSSKRTNDDEDSSTSQPVRKFGDFIDNYGWIQCPSKSYPDRVYFHNTHSNCNTWYRPVSRYIDIPFISVKKVYQTDDDISANNIELLSVSDNENEPDVSAAKRDGDKSSTVPDVITRYYYTPQVDLTSDDDSCRSSVDASASECHEKKQIDENNNNENDEDIANEKSDSETVLCAANFLEIDFFVGENPVNTEKIDRIFDTSTVDTDDDSSFAQSSFDAPCSYDVPRLKRISLEDQLIKLRRTRVSNRSKVQKPRRIVCEMYGTRTINYDLPTPDQAPAEVGVKLSTLSDSDSDGSEASPQDAKTTLSFESQWCDIEKNLHQPLLSDPSSSPSSRSDTSSTSSTISSCSTCSSST